MAFCNIENTFLGKKLDNAFFPDNRNRIANLLDNQDFKTWFGKGRIDKDSNPVLDEELSFTNEKGEKKTIFDFLINFENTGEVQKTLLSSPAIHRYKGSIFINNTKKDITGEFLAKKAMRMINVINFYYPGLLTLDIYQRTASTDYSKDKSIPLPIIKISTSAPLVNKGNLFSVHQTQTISANQNQYKQLRSVEALEALQATTDEFRVYGLAPEDLKKITESPEISKEVYDRLVGFVKKLNPNFKVQEINNLPVAGAAYIHDFLIQLDEKSKFRALPEEVAHFFIELLPEGSMLLKDLLSNVTNFAIYSTTLASYKNRKEYQLPNGKPNYDKIKREAAAKLVAEYTYALSMNDTSRIATLTKTKDNFIKRWWEALIRWITKGVFDRKRDMVKAYLEAANAILSDKIEYLDPQQVTISQNRGVFFSLSDANKVAMAQAMMSKVISAGKLEDLQNVVDKFRRELAGKFIAIVKQDTFTKLNEELQKDEHGGTIGINYLSELYDVMKGIDLTEVKTTEMLTAENQILNLSEFLNTIANLGKMANAIDIITDYYIDSKDIMKNIAELQAYRDLYGNFQTFIKSDLRNILTDSQVEAEVIASLNNTMSIFEAIDGKILRILRENFSKWMKDTVAPQNARIMQLFTKDLEKIWTLEGSDHQKKQVADLLQQYVRDLNSDIPKLEAQVKLSRAVVKLGIPEALVTSDVVAGIFDKVNTLYVRQAAIEDLLTGMGKDIDPASFSSHIVTAAIKNHDMIFADVANFIVQKKSNAQNLAAIAIRSFQAKVNPLLQKLKSNHGMDEYAVGKAATYIDEISDKTLDNKGELVYKDGKRQIVKFLNPTINDVYLEKERLLNAKNEARKKWKAADASQEKAAKAEFVKARKEYLDHLDEHWNSPFKEELVQFQKNWNKNDKFLEIKEEWDILTAELRRLQEMLENENGETMDYQELVVKQRQRAKLLSETDKTGEELEKTQLLKQYFDESRKYRVEDLRKTVRNLQAAKNNYEAKLDYAIAEFLKTHRNPDNRPVEELEQTLRLVMKDDNIRIANRYIYFAIGRDDIFEDNITGDREIEAVKEILLQDWEVRNTVKVRNEKYFEYQKQLMKDIDDLKKLQGISPLEQRISDLYKELNELMFSRKDVYGQRNPALLTPEERERFTDLEDSIEQLKEIRVPTYAILPEVRANPRNKKYITGMDAYEAVVKEVTDMTSGIIPFDAGRFETLRRDILESNKTLIEIGVITKRQTDISSAISELWAQLASLSDRVPTQVYLENIEELIPILETIMEHELGKPTDKMSAKEKRNHEVEIKNLVYLIKGQDGKGGLHDAIYGQNYELLDQILNDEYFITVNDQRVHVPFKKYIEEGDMGEPSMIDSISPEFADWFYKAHKEGRAFVDDFDPQTNTRLEKKKAVDRSFIRRMYYTYSDPSENQPEYFDVKAASRYRATKIADEWYKPQITWKDSEDMEDWTIDNRVGEPRYLPLSRKQRRAQGKGDSKYLNKAYYELKDAKDEKSRLLDEYLNISLRTYLEEQETKPDAIKSMFNLPVTSLDSFQRDAYALTNLPGDVKRVGQRVKSLFKPSHIDAEDMLAGIEQMRDVDETTQAIISNKMPALGMNAKLDVDRVNRNVLHAITMYIHNSKDFDTRSDLRPFMKGLVDVMKAASGPNQKNRTKLFDQIYSQMILQELPDNITNMRFFRKIANTLLSLTGLKLMGDVVGGGVNYIQANINNLIEAFAYKHVSPRNYLNGYMKATEMMGHLAVDFSKKSGYSYWTLMYQAFDFVQGDWIEDLAERSAVKNKLFDWRKILMYPRKNGELHAQSAMGISILDRTKVKNQVDGKMYPVWDIYKKEGDQLVLKEGFWEYQLDDQGNSTDVKVYPWNPRDGAKFIAIKDKIHSVNLDLHGNYAKINQTEASRHSIGRIAENMKRWFVAGFQRRFGRESFDVNKQDLDQGYYTTTALFLYHTLKHIVRLNTQAAAGQFRFYWGTPRKKENLKRFAAEMLICVLLFLTSTMLFGYDSDDEDKNKKLRASSWFHNEMLLIALRTYAEQTAYIPAPPFGFTEMTRNLLDPFSVAKGAFGNVVGAATLAIYTAGYYTGFDDLIGRNWEDEVIYQRDSGGRFGKKGELKLVNYLFKTFGYTGSQLDPAYYIQNYQSLQNRLK